jgi:DNA polymerase III subunit delta'
MKLDEAFDYLSRVCSSSRVAQAYIIEGDPRGDAQVLAERTLALLFCEANKKPCGECKSCHQIKHHTHPDALWIEPQKKSRIISIEQVRNLQQLIFQTAFAGGWKACVLVGADRLGAPAANAFLKTLEEPPGKSVFFLLTDSPQSLLPTIWSRCQHIGLSGDEVNLREEWKDMLTDILAASGNRTGTASLGAAERTIRLLKQMKSAAYDEECEAAEARATEDENGANKPEEDDDTLDARAEARFREWRRSVMRLIMNWHRDVLLLVCGSEEDLLFNDSHARMLREAARGTSKSKAVNNLRIIEEMNRRIDENLPEAPVLSYGFSRLG